MKNSTLIENENEILFYRCNGEFGFLSNLFPCKVIIDEIEFKSSEFAYQYAKFRNETDKEKEILEWVMKAPNSSLVAQLAHSLFAWQISQNWTENKIKRMRDVLYAKFTQNLDLKEKLLKTKGLTLIENSKTDSFWGIGAKNKGENMLGKLLMELRDTF